MPPLPAKERTAAPSTVCRDAASAANEPVLLTQKLLSNAARSTAKTGNVGYNRNVKRSCKRSSIFVFNHSKGHRLEPLVERAAHAKMFQKHGGNIVNGVSKHPSPKRSKNQVFLSVVGCNGKK